MLHQLHWNFIVNVNTNRFKNQLCEILTKLSKEPSFFLAYELPQANLAEIEYFLLRQHLISILIRNLLSNDIMLVIGEESKFFHLDEEIDLVFQRFCSNWNHCLQKFIPIQKTYTNKSISPSTVLNYQRNWYRWYRISSPQALHFARTSGIYRFGSYRSQCRPQGLTQLISLFSLRKNTYYNLYISETWFHIELCKAPK